jgi:hypothetical protein
MMEAVRASETAVYFNEFARRYISEGFHLHTRRCESLKYKLQYNFFIYAIAVHTYALVFGFFILASELASGI